MNFKRLDPKSKETDSIVIFLHGYGADGADLLSIGDVLSEHLPNTLFVAPDAPRKCQMSPFGFQWFSIPEIDGTSSNSAMKELDEMARLGNKWIDQLILKEGVNEKKVFLFGFSQGTMLSLYMGPQRLNALGGIIGFSGKLVNLDIFKKKIFSRPPILLIHGDKDQVVPYSCLNRAFDDLIALNFMVEKHVSHGIAHGIAPDGLDEALSFISSKNS